MNTEIRQASPSDSSSIAMLVIDLLSEIMTNTGDPHFRLDLVSIKERLEEWLLRDTYVAFVAVTPESEHVLGFITLCESYALYAEGVIGTIPEFYVRPESRSQGVGRLLLDHSIVHARNKGWRRLEVTTPPLPVFEKTFRFYEHQGFSIAGGRKLKRLI
ncbi:MAG: GNAT family N-acetyltransferase [Nitrospirota bacterium]|nr:GNAT family N-acetyltransferase [Nitrospirota bacterium]